MSWNYRVVRSPNAEEGISAIHEVYCSEASGEPRSWTENPVDVSAENLDGLRWVLDRMQDALSKPILEERAASFTSSNEFA
jgi:hypothetical protein